MRDVIRRLTAPHKGVPYVPPLTAPYILAALLLGIVAPPRGVPAAAAQHAPAAPAPDLRTLLERTAVYVRDFELAFTRIVGSETYRQTLQQKTRRATRLIESDVFFLGIDAEGTSVTVRDALRVDGQPVRGSRERIEQALAGNRSDSRRLLRQLADEGARHNLGDLQRNFSDPLLALTFLDPDRQDRFRLELGPPDVIDGVILRRLNYRETRRPTLIRNARDGRDVPASGAIFVADDGSIRRTEMEIDAPPTTTATIRVFYREDPKLGMLVPDTLEEEYRSYKGNDEVLITGVATYSDYRRFETSGRVLER